MKDLSTREIVCQKELKIFFFFFFFGISKKELKIVRPRSIPFFFFFLFLCAEGGDSSPLVPTHISKCCMKNFPKMLTQSVKNMVYDKVDCEMVCLMVFHEIHEILRSKLLAHILRLPSRNSPYNYLVYVGRENYKHLKD